MTPHEASALLARIVDYAQEVSCKPLGDHEQRRRRCEQLGTELETAIQQSPGMQRYLDNAAPLCLHAIDRALFRRANLDHAGAERWDSIIGVLWPLVRGDGAAALELSKEVLRS